jgi:hypothetical protein
MRQALHIFRKDVRGLWIYIAQVLVMTLLFAVSGSLRAAHPLDPRLSEFGTAFGLVMLLVWGILVGVLIQAEPLVGDRHFWLTRPYCWRSLLAAKLLFLGAFILLPKLLADMVILSAHGFAPLPLLPGLVSRLAALAVFDLLPVALIAAMSPNFLTFALTTVSASGALFSFRFVLAGTQWSDGSAPRIWTAQYAGCAALALTCVALLIWQYARRRTLRTLACALAAVAVFPQLAGFAFSWTNQFAIQSRLAPLHPAPASFEVSLDPASRWEGNVTTGPDGRRSIEIPIRISGSPAGTVPVLEGARVTIQTPSGVFTPGAQPWLNIGTRTLTGSRTRPSLQFALDASRWRNSAYQPLKLRGTVYLALYGHLRHTQIAQPDRQFDLAGVAQCGMYEQGMRLGPVLICQSPLGFRPGQFMATLYKPGATLDGVEPGVPERLAAAPLILSTAFDPLRFTDEIDPISEFRSYRSTGNDDQPLVGFQEPLGYVTVDFELPGVLLANYEPRLTGLTQQVAGTIQGRVTCDGPAPPHGIAVALVNPAAFRVQGFRGFVELGNRLADGTYFISAPQLGTYYIVAAPIGRILLLYDGVADRQTKDLLMRYARKVTISKVGERISVDLTAQTR